MFTYLLAQAPTATPPGGLSALSPFVMFGLLGVIMYYMMIRPQAKRQKEHARLISALKTGDHVVTTSGIHGMISNVKDTTVIVKVADNVKLEMEKSAVTSVAKAAEG
jgi:preprotein translocase subunit YajC